MEIHSKKIFNWKAFAAISIIVLIVAISVLLYYYYPSIKNKNNLYVYIKPVNENIRTVTADSSNRFILKAEVRNKFGEPVPNVHLRFSVDNNIGILDRNSARTNKLGEVLVTYIPPDTAFSAETLKNQYNDTENFINNVQVIVRASISNKLNIFNIFYETRSDKYVFNLVQVPIVLVHGYQSTSDIFTNMISYLNSRGFYTIPFDYNSLEGVIQSANKLKEFLSRQTQVLFLEDIQVKRFDIVSHSMGGIVSRYYSVHEDYIEYSNIRKLIFIATPHKGSHLAHIGAEYFNDQGVKDMMPNSELYQKTFPQMINKGLNPSIQIGNIIGQFDEVVSIESASLPEWEIDTRIFNLGDNKFNVDNLLDVTNSQNAIHKVILNNKKVYEIIVDMLTTTLKYPSKIK